MPSRTVISRPTATAASSSAPDASAACAAASAAGTTDADGCTIDGRWVSSKSRECASTPLTNAAVGAEVGSCIEMAVARGRTTDGAGEVEDRGRRVEAGGGDRQADDVEHPLRQRVAQAGRQIVEADGGTEVPESVDERGVGHHQGARTASGRTGDPVAPTRCSGATTSVAVVSPVAASSSSARVSMM